MILKAENFTLIKKDIDLSKLEDPAFYIVKVQAINGGSGTFTNKEYDEMRVRESGYILEQLKKIYPEHFV